MIKINKYYNNIEYNEYYVLAKETFHFNNIYLEYVSEIKNYNNKVYIIWTQDLNLAYTFSFGNNLSKREVKLAIEKFLKKINLFGKAYGYKVKSIDKVQNKII